MKFDATDLQLMHYLQMDAKQTHKELSHKLNLSVTAVYERIKKLEREEVIKGYTALLSKSKLEREFVVFCQIKLSEHLQHAITEFEKEVKKLDEVVECFHVSGEYDYLLKVLVKNMDDFRRFMVDKLTTLRHIGSTQSSFSISEVKNSTQIPLSI